MKQAKQVCNSNVVAVTLLLVGVFVELVMPLGILSGIADPLASSQPYATAALPR